MNVSSVRNLWSVSILWAVGVCSLQRFVCLHIVSCICHHNYHEHIQTVSCVSPGCELYVSSCARVTSNKIGAGQPYLLCRFFLFRVLKLWSELWMSPVSPIYDLCLHIVSCRRLQSMSYGVSIFELCLQDVIFVRLHTMSYICHHSMNIYRLWVVSLGC